MYKRQFLKWDWRKYNNKRGERGHFDGKSGQYRGRNPTCRRPRRQQLGDWQTNGSAALAATSTSPFSQSLRLVTERAMPRSMLHGSETDRWTEVLYASLYDLIRGSARQSPTWRNASKLTLIYAPGSVDVLLQFRLAMDQLGLGHMKYAGVALRQAFRDLDALAEEDPCTVFQVLILEIPTLLCQLARDRETQL